MPKGNQDHRPVAMTVATAFAGFGAKLFDLELG
jgi:hypothetical protein